MSFQFLTNLNKITYDPVRNIGNESDGYLLSTKYHSKSNLELFKQIGKIDKITLSDNGNFTRMKILARKFKKDVQRLKQFDSNIEMPKMEAFVLDLVERIKTECRNYTNKEHVIKITNDQLLGEPKRIIGFEDLTLSVLRLSNLMEHPFYQIHRFKPDIKESIRFFNGQNQLLKNTALNMPLNYFVIHAIDYDTCYRFSKEISMSGINNIAISFGPTLSSRKWTKNAIVGQADINFKFSMPDKYVNSMLLALGGIKGNNKINSLHILGIGTPILIALLGYHLRHLHNITIDSTAPHRDSESRKIYGDKNALIKMKIHKLLAYQISRNEEFETDSPYYSKFLQTYSHDWFGYFKNFKNYRHLELDKLIKVVKEKENLIVKHIPFFSRISMLKDKQKDDLRLLRAAHNNWVIKVITEKISNLKNDNKLFQEWIENQIFQYSKYGNIHWVRAVKQTHNLCNKLNTIDNKA